MTTTHPSPLVESPYAADNIDLVGNKDSELQDLTSRLADKATACGTEVSIGKSKIMNNSMNKNNSMNFKTSPADS